MAPKIPGCAATANRWSAFSWSWCFQCAAACRQRVEAYDRRIRKYSRRGVVEVVLYPVFEMDGISYASPNRQSPWKSSSTAIPCCRIAASAVHGSYRARQRRRPLLLAGSRARPGLPDRFRAGDSLRLVPAACLSTASGDVYEPLLPQPVLFDVASTVQPRRKCVCVHRHAHLPRRYRLYQPGSISDHRAGGFPASCPKLPWIRLAERQRTVPFHL